MTARIGLIVENQSDEDVIATLVSRLTSRKVQYRSFHSRGCGKLKSKCVAWASDLFLRGSRILLVVQDLDKNDLATLRKEIETLVSSTPFSKRCVVIPVREIEAWLLADEQGIASAFSLKKVVSATTSPELESDAKGRLYEVVYAASEKRVEYVNTVHNKRIATQASITRIQSKCPSFSVLSHFVGTAI
ncbi:MAG TPA: DUF4276 family protein [Burkholderiales bacterium]|nr:DUF4276 family protein [Burkholderiales bacterium]